MGISTASATRTVQEEDRHATIPLDATDRPLRTAIQGHPRTWHVLCRQIPPDQGASGFERQRGLSVHPPPQIRKDHDLSMLDAFFNIQYAGNPWFDDLEISRSRDTPSMQVTRTDSRSSISISTIRKRTPTNHTSTSSVSQLRTPTSRTDTFSKMTISIPRSGTTSIPSPGVTYRRISYPPRSRTSRMQYPGTTEDQSSSSMNTIVQ